MFVLQSNNANRRLSKVVRVLARNNIHSNLNVFSLYDVIQARNFPNHFSYFYISWHWNWHNTATNKKMCVPLQKRRSWYLDFLQDSSHVRKMSVSRLVKWISHSAAQPLKPEAKTTLHHAISGTARIRDTIIIQKNQGEKCNLERWSRKFEEKIKIILFQTKIILGIYGRNLDSAVQEVMAYFCFP